MEKKPLLKSLTSAQNFNMQHRDRQTSFTQCFPHINLFAAVCHNINIGRHILIFGAARPILTHSGQRIHHSIAQCFILQYSEWRCGFYFAGKANKKRGGGLLNAFGLTITSPAKKTSGLIIEIKPLQRDIIL